MHRILLLALVIGLIAPVRSSAEDLTGRWGFGIESGLMKLVGGNYDHSNLDQYLCLSIGRSISAHWSVDWSLKYGWVRPGVQQPNRQAAWTLNGEAGLYTSIWQPRLGVTYRLTPHSAFTPTVGLTAGLTSWSVRDQRERDGVSLHPDGPVLSGFDADGNPAELQDSNFTASLAIGAELFPAHSWAIQGGIRYHRLIGNDLDSIGFSGIADAIFADVNDGLLDGYLGIAIFFGPRDSDGDGIRDRHDTCPDRREDFDGYEDSDGCPDRDNDRDGLTDSQDRCPDSPEDYDGFSDQDGCPDPDNDNDGLPDAIDHCPDEAEDRDGFSDQDGCPDLDNDNDGVPDSEDACSETGRGVRVDETGCPVVQVIPTRALTLEGVTFESGSARLTPPSWVVLRRVAESLLAHPDVLIELLGHTDNLGPSEVNRILSLRRAMAVRDALIQLGVGPARVTAFGYGEDVPLVPNDTPAGRARNRRVEIRRIGF